MSFSSYHLYFDDLEVGQEWASGGRTVTEADIVNFAGFSGDFNPIHIDHEFAKTTPFRRPIAHGFGVFCIASGLGVNSPPVRTIALLRVNVWNFILPVFAGDTMRSVTEWWRRRSRPRPTRRSRLVPRHHQPGRQGGAGGRGGDPGGVPDWPAHEAERTTA